MTESTYSLLFTAADGKEIWFNLPLGELRLGRHELQEFLGILDDTVSSQHLCFDCTDTSCLLEDLGSRNGSWVNDERLNEGDPPRALIAGDTVSIGASEPITEFVLVDHLSHTIRAKLANLRFDSSLVDDAHPSRASGNDHVPGLDDRSVYLIQFLPEIYHSPSQDLLHRLLALFEHTLLPVRWNITDFDLYLDPCTAPPIFYPWLLQWYGIALDDSWDGPRIRTLISEAHQIYARLGTAWALKRVLEIYLDKQDGEVQIRDQGNDLHRGAFEVTLTPTDLPEIGIRRAIEAHKPAHTRFVLNFVDGS